MPSEPLIPPAWSRAVIDAQLRDIGRRWTRASSELLPPIAFPPPATALRAEIAATVALIEAVQVPPVRLHAFDSEGATD